MFAQSSCHDYIKQVCVSLQSKKGSIYKMLESKGGQEERKDTQRSVQKLAEQNLRLGCDVHVLARTEMCRIQRSA